VIAGGSDPIQSGLVVSLARPGGNVTGLTNYSAELLGKRLELLKEVVPKVSRYAFLDATASGPGVSRSMLPDAQAAAQALGVKLQLVEVKAQDPDIDGAFQVMVKERIGALITGAGILGLTLFSEKGFWS
jgi:putative ABC transport system substrate-binding protein